MKKMQHQYKTSQTEGRLVLLSKDLLQLKKDIADNRRVIILLKRDKDADADLVDLETEVLAEMTKDQETLQAKIEKINRDLEQVPNQQNESAINDVDAVDDVPDPEDPLNDDNMEDPLFEPDLV